MKVRVSFRNIVDATQSKSWVRVGDRVRVRRKVGVGFLVSTRVKVG